MKYMGSKRELLDNIRSIIDKQNLEGKAVLDLFAGTCGVGMSLRDLAPIYSNDIQKYSQVIANGNLTIQSEALSKLEILKLIEKNYKKNYQAVHDLLPNVASKSESYKDTKDWADNKRLEYIKFAEELSKNILEGNSKNIELNNLRKLYDVRKSDNREFPYIQTTAIFSEMYFSLDQCASIDSLKYAIDNLDKNHQFLKDSLLAALIHAYSYASAGTGHFAQFRDLSTLSSIKDVFIYRRKSVMDLFLRKAEEILEISNKNKYYESSKSFADDYIDLMTKDSVMSKVGIIYADPPYSFVHYSRFYHAIEDLCRYDYPDVEMKGRYRKDRHQSPFCIKTKAPGAFDSMFKLAAKHGVPLLVSYSNTGMITLEALNEIAVENGYKVENLEVDHKHSTMGRLKDKHRDVKEALMLCKLT